MGPAFDMSYELPPPNLALSLCPNLLEPTLGIQRRAYWEEVNPLLTKWCRVNNTKCPECSRVIKVNMSRHLRLIHTTHMCYWRCPVPDCPLWFTSELNGKDHIEHTHRFREGRGYSFYECLREFGLEWFESRAFFEEKKVTGQSLWMDLALARRSGQELRNTYTITSSPDFAPLRRFFKAAVDQLQLLYNEMPLPTISAPQPPMRSLIESIQDEVYASSISSDNSVTRESPVEEFVVDKSPVDIFPSPPTDNVPRSSLADVTPVRSLTPVNWSWRFLETGDPGSPLTHMLPSRAAVPGLCIASTDLLSYIDPLPMDWLDLHSARAVRDWPSADREQLLVVAHRDLHVTRRNVAELTRYLDDQAAHLAVCAGAEDDRLPLMTVETFPRLRGGVRAVLDYP